jgi:hypothetical protein
MSWKLASILIGLSLFTSGFGAQYIDEVRRNADKLLKASQRYVGKARQARDMGRLSEAAQYSQQAVYAAQQAERELRQAQPPTAQLSNNISSLLQEIKEANVKAQKSKLETEADDVITRTVDRLKSMQGKLANESEGELKNFVTDFLCFYVDNNFSPKQEEYTKFFSKTLEGKFLVGTREKRQIEEKLKGVHDFAIRMSQLYTSSDPKIQEGLTLFLQGECLFH